MLKLRFFFLFVVLLLLVGTLSADIKFNGVCGAYSYKLDIPHNKFFGGMCVGGQLYVYNDKATDEIQGIYVDPLVSTYLDIFDLQNYKVLDNLDYTVNDGEIIIISDPSFHFLAGLAGLITGLSFLYVVMRLV
jgi:hypothetical protein